MEELKNDTKMTWSEQVWEACKGKCSNCGSEDKVRARMLVPVAAGGQKTVSNGALFCRTCEMAMESVANGGRDSERRMLNFWVSQELHSRLQNGLRSRYGFKSVGSLLRFLMGLYVDQPNRFDDLHLYQQSGSDVKMNVWVDIAVYEEFRRQLSQRSMTVTDAVKALVTLYEQDAEPLIKARRIEG